MRTTKLNSFLQVDQQSLVQSIEQAIAKQGHVSTQVIKTRSTGHTKAGQAFIAANQYEINAGSAAYPSRNQYRFKLDSLPQSIILPSGKSDVYYPMIEVKDNTSPGQAFSVSMGIYRQVCSNGLMARLIELPELRIRHVPGNAKLLNAFEVWLEFTLTDFITNIGHGIQALASRPVASPLTTLRAVATSINLPKRTIEVLERQLISNNIDTSVFRAEDDVNTVWGLYNVINEIDRVESRRGQAYLNRDTALLDAILVNI